MTNLFGRYLSEVSDAAKLERQLSLALGQYVDDLAHAECFDTEKRSELYTILSTLRSETIAHNEMLGQWIPADETDAANA